ncbi:hypothetical protein BJF78_09730 [Pseudonocardia sp. CNS-139]|nr:hypothetical protein BJF78_09730 [Pseudonocardia sp. CNS-139]
MFPGAGDAAERSAYSGLDWTGALTKPVQPGRPEAPAEPALPEAAAAPPVPLTLPPPAAGFITPTPPAPLSTPGEQAAHDRGVAAVAFADALRSPGEVRWDLAAIAQSLLITLVLLALLALPAGIVNGTAEANAGRIGAALARLRVRP